MQKLNFTLGQQQKLSPQQIQFIKLLQVPTIELESRIEQELEDNPALEEGKEEEERTTDEVQEDNQEEINEDLDINDYIQDDEIHGYKMQGDRADPNEEDKSIPISSESSTTENLLNQLTYLKLDEKSMLIGEQLIGSIEGDGYIRREISAIVNDLAFTQGVETDLDEVESLLFKIQQFDPAGIAARSLQECLLLQLERKDQDEIVIYAIRMLENQFDEFTKKHYDKILKKLNIDENTLKDIISQITKLNPKPGDSAQEIVKAQYLHPDFIITNNNGQLDITLNSRNAPDLRVSRSYSDMLDSYDKSDKRDKKLKEAVSFVKQKLDAAKWFIDAIRQRQQTLLYTMNAIVEFQYEFFQEGDETKLKPMILKNIAEKIDMDISTVSRVANSKSVQMEFGIYPLKYFFSEGISTDSGEDVSSREVKSILKQLIEEEDKKKPYSDDKLEKLLRVKGYNIARRTVAKYREQLDISVARLRKEL